MLDEAFPCRKTVIQFCLAIAGLCLMVYGFSLFSDFVYWDDPILILDNAVIRGLTITNVIRGFTSYDPELYVPLTTLSFQMNYAIAGLQPFLYHLTNFLLHIGSAILVGWVTHQWTRKFWIAAFVAALFAVHPINVETVVWISARKDVLASFFLLLSLGCLLHWKAGAASRWYWVGVIAFTAALLSKVSVLSLPVALLLIDWREKKLSVKSLAPTIPFFALSFIFGIVALFGKHESSRHFVAKILMAGRAVPWMLFHHVVPVRLSVLYPYEAPIGFGSPDLVLGVAATIILSVAAWLIRYRLRDVTFGWFWFLLFLAPSFLNIEKGGDTIRDVYITSDRYAYIAGIGIFFAVATQLYRLRDRRIYFAVAGSIVTALAVVAFFVSLTWRNTETLFRHVLTLYPQSHVAWNNIGAYHDQLGEVEEAQDAYRTSLALKETGYGWFNIGQIAMKENRKEDAIKAFTRAIELRPYHPYAQQNLGALLLDAGKLDEALAHLLEAQKLDPKSLATYLNLGIVLERLGNRLDARRAYERALQIDPQNEYALQRIKAL